MIFKLFVHFPPASGEHFYSNNINLQLGLLVCMEYYQIRVHLPPRLRVLVMPGTSSALIYGALHKLAYRRVSFKQKCLQMVFTRVRVMINATRLGISHHSSSCSSFRLRSVVNAVYENFAIPSIRPGIFPGDAYPTMIIGHMTDFPFSVSSMSNTKATVYQFHSYLQLRDHTHLPLNSSHFLPLFPLHQLQQYPNAAYSLHCMETQNRHHREVLHHTVWRSFPEFKRSYTNEMLPN